MYTNTTRITGLSGSGIDTDGMVEKLMYAESSKLFRYQQSVTWKTWQQEAYRSAITKFKDFQSKWCTSTSTGLKYSAAFTSFKNSVKSSKGGDSEAITINKSTSSQEYEIEIEQLAKKDTYVAGRSVSKEIKGNVDVDALATKLNNGEKVELKFTLDGSSKTITLTKDNFDDATGSSNSEKLENLLNSELKSSFGQENGTNKISINIDNAGSFELNTILGHEVSIASGGASSESVYTSTGINATEDDSKKATGTFNVTVNGNDYTVTIEEDTTNKLTLAQKINNALKKAKNSTGVETDISKHLVANIDDSNNLVLSAKDSAVKISNVTNGDNGNLAAIVPSTTLKSSNDLNNYFGITDGANKVTNSTTLEDAFGDNITWNGDTASITINGKTTEFKKDDNLATFIKNINSSGAGVNISYNSTQQKFKIESSESGAVNKIKFGTDANTQNALTALGFSISGGSVDSSQHTVEAQDAILTIDGVETTRTSNTIDLDGMNITLNKTTEAGEVLTIGNDTDVDAMYETISKFVEEYNTLISDLNKQVKETRARADDYSYYEPLTDLQKKEMDEDEIKLWEEKAKTGLLYRDSTISTVLTKMRSTLYTSLTKVDGSKISLYNFGITTSSDYSENGKLVIDETKLKDAIKNNLEDVQALFTGSGTKEGVGLADKLEEIIDGAVGVNGSLREKAGITGTSSANENTLSRQIKSLNDQISKEKERLTNKESKYYSLFATMETSITNSNSQLDALFSMMSY